MSNYKKAIIALIVANIIWGAGAPIFKWSLQGISPLMLAFCRFFIPVLILLFFYKHIQRIKLRDSLYIILLGVLICTFNIGFFFMGLLYAPSINSPVIGSSGPILILLGSIFFLREKPTKKVLLGNIVGLAGVLFIVLEPFLQVHQKYSLFGNFLFLLSTIAGVLGTLVSKKLTKKYNTTTLTFWTFCIATITLLPIPLNEISTSTMSLHINIPALIGIAFGGVFSSLLAYSLFYWGLSRIKASETSVFTYIDPVAAILIAAPLLHEFPTPIYIFGSVLVFFGIYVAEGRLHWHPLHRLFDGR